MTTTYISTSIPYVNSRPHVGFALELVQADILARTHRRSTSVLFSTGTDDHAIKNRIAADRFGVDVHEFVDTNADGFVELGARLGSTNDVFLRTSRDARHIQAVHDVWKRCVASGDIYQHAYSGDYCAGCEAFLAADELTNGKCPEHGKSLETITENNYFFRLSRYQDELRELIESRRLQIEPISRVGEVLAVLDQGLSDFSISRPVSRSRGWGIAVPGDPSQTIYVWFDALINYLTGTGYGSSPDEFERWWVQSSQRTHVIGKGILRFHALYWPAMLLSAGIALPTHLFVHDYLTADGVKIGKSAGNAANPIEPIDRFGVDPLRWWLASDVPASRPTDFNEERLVERWNTDLVNGFGNLCRRVTTLINQHFDGVVPPALESAARLDALVVSGFEIRAATDAICAAIRRVNADLEAAKPWETLKVAPRSETASHVLASAHENCVLIAEALEPFCPSTAAAVIEALGGTSGTVHNEAPFIPRLTLDRN